MNGNSAWKCSREAGFFRGNGKARSRDLDRVSRLLMPLMLVLGTCLALVHAPGVGQESSGFFSVSAEKPGVSSTASMPVLINGNDELIAFPNKTGSGTEQDPFVIGDLYIDANGSSHGISLNSTNLFVVIEGCTVVNASAAGFRLLNVTNVEVRNSSATGCTAGMEIVNSSLARVESLVSSSNGVGLAVYNSTNTTIIDGTFENSTDDGMLLSNCTGSEFRNNTIQWNGRDGCVLDEFSTGNVIFLNRFLNNTRYQAVSNMTGNLWSNGSQGNYWSNYRDLHPTATNDGRTWNVPMAINGSGGELDEKPLVNPDGGLGNLENHLTHPEDLVYVYGTTGNEITWIVTSLYSINPRYVVYVNGAPWESGTWYSGEELHVNVDGLGLGDYNVTIVAGDDLGGSVQDDVYLIVLENDPPTISGLDNFTMTRGDPAHPLQWTIDDPTCYPGATYSILVNGSVAEQSSWADGSTITFPTTSLSVGLYNFTLVASDGAGSFSTNTVLVNVVFPTNVEPVILTPGSFSHVRGHEWPEVGWVVYDDTMLNATYTILNGNQVLDSGPCDNGQTIIIPKLDLQPGEYNITLVVDDGLGGVSRDSITIRASEPSFSEQMSGFFQDYWLHVLVFAIIVAVSVLSLYGWVIYRKKRGLPLLPFKSARKEGAVAGKKPKGERKTKSPEGSGVPAKSGATGDPKKSNKANKIAKAKEAKKKAVSAGAGDSKAKNGSLVPGNGKNKTGKGGK